MRSALTLAALALLAGCASQPAYQTPTLALPAAFRHAGSGELAAFAGERWWESFGDPVLDHLVDEGLAGGYDIAIAAARLRQAAAGVRSAEAAKMPLIGFDASAQYQSQSIKEPIGAFASQFPGYQRTSGLFGLNGAASWEIDLFGGLAAGSRAADADQTAARAGLAGARLTLAAELVNSYLDAREFQARLTIANARIATLSELERIVQLQVDRGIAPRSAADAVSAELSAARTAVPALQAGLEVAFNRIDVLAGRAPGAAAAEMGEGAIPAAPVTGVSSAPAALLTRRPDLVAAEREVAAADAHTAEAIAAQYPRLNIGSLFGLLSTGLGSLFSGAALQSQSGIGLSGPVLSFGRNAARIEAARGRTDEAVARYRQTVIRAVAEVEDSVFAVERRSEILRQTLAAENSVTRARDAAKAAHGAGVTSLAEVLQVERRREDAQDAVIQARADSGRAAVAAFRALGGGWNAATDLAGLAPTSKEK